MTPDSVLQRDIYLVLSRSTQPRATDACGKKGPHCLRPDLSGRVCGTAAGIRRAREAEGQVEGGLSFASFSLAAKENEEKRTNTGMKLLWPNDR